MINSWFKRIQYFFRFFNLYVITLYFVGQYKEQNNTVEIQGIFSSEKKALTACKDRTYFIHPLILDKELPHESNKWQGYYPIEE